MDERQDNRAFWILAFGLLLLTRGPAMASYLSIDNVNLAFSLDNFDPRIHQPQPPGYPFFVGFAKVVNLVLRDAERTFIAISLLASALCLPAAFALGARMFSPWAGAAGAILLLVNPVFWFSGIEGPLRPFLALFSLLTAYCCWRCWNGEKRFAMWGALALGVGSGFRPDLLAFLLPVWLVSVWAGAKSFRTAAAATALLGAIILAWTAALVIAMGGIAVFAGIMTEYAVEQSPESMVFGNPLVSWLKQISRLAVWNGLAILTWIWVLPFSRIGDRRGFGRKHGAFFFIWVVPGLAVQALIHIASPGHALASVVALCVLGGYVLSLIPARDAALAPALVLNSMLFLGFFSIPAGVTNSPGEAPSFKDAMLFGVAETSITLLRSVDDTVRTSLAELRELTPSDRPSVIVAGDTYKDKFFMNWRVARYYLPERDLWVLYKKGTNYGVERVRRDAYLGKLENDFVRFTIPTNCRILWLIEPQGDLYRRLSSAHRLVEGRRWVFYTDISSDSPPIRLDGIEIAPSPFGLAP